MGERGPKSRPNHLKALEGVREDRINRDEPIPTEDRVAPPRDMSDEAWAVWHRLAPDLTAKNVLTAWDVDAFSAFCEWVAVYQRAASEVRDYGIVARGSQDQRVIAPALKVMAEATTQMRSLGSRFGLTPADRAELKVDTHSGRKSGAEAYLA